jgi:hypothetical protein
MGFGVLTFRLIQISTGRAVGSECRPGSAATHSGRMYADAHTPETSEKSI